MITWKNWKPWRLRQSPNARVDLYTNLADLLDAGIPEQDALGLVWRALSENGTEKGRPAACAATAWLDALERSESFDVAVRGWVPAAEQLLFTGRSEGKRVAALRQAAELAERAGQLRKAIVGNMFYPMVLAILAVWMIWLMGTQIIPVLADARPGASWRGVGAHLITASRLLDQWGAVILAAIVGLLVAVMASLPRWITWPRRWLDMNLPPWSIYRVVQETSFLMALAAQMQSGVSIDEAIKELGDAAPAWLRSRLHAILEHLEGGDSLADAMELAANAFPSGDIVGQIGIFERSGNLTDRMPALARNRVARAVARIQVQMSTLNMLLMGAIAMVIAGVGVGLVDLMDQTTSAVQ